MTKKRVVVTGMGVVSPFGVGSEKLWENVVNGKSGIYLKMSFAKEAAKEIRKKDRFAWFCTTV